MGLLIFCKKGPLKKKEKEGKCLQRSKKCPALPIKCPILLRENHLLSCGMGRSTFILPISGWRALFFAHKRNVRATHFYELNWFFIDF
jgi:hypothetical protein